MTTYGPPKPPPKKPPPHLMTLDRAAHVLDRCDYPGFRFVLDKAPGGEMMLQVETDVVDQATGEPWSNCRGRKWRVSAFMTDSELVATAFKAVLTFVEHEARESFTYRGRRVFGPHIDVNALWSVADQTDERPPA